MDNYEKKGKKGLQPNGIERYKASTDKSGARSGKMHFESKGGSFDRKDSSLVPRKA
jgi:hypothetical protein